MSNIIVGTAGHIDHGKTTLVKALTGIDTDRLAEEKARGITIELGFAHLLLPGGNTAAIVDVPGHERFIKNMLAGAAGIDIALLVVAADEGVMPQTIEHLDILTLLAIKKVIVVITKVDLVEKEYMALVREDIGKLLSDTVYHDAAILEVAAPQGWGLNELIELLGLEASANINARKTETPARLPLDRVFVMQGFGTVVTGTLFDGQINTGDNLEIAVKQKRFRVRSLQVHNQTVTKAVAGQRVAINLAGAEAKEIEKGDVLTMPGWFAATSRIDVSCHLLKNSPWRLQPYTRVRFYQGTKEAFGRVTLFDRAEVLPGQSAYLQIALEEPIVVCRGDNYIIRSYSPSVTIGGGKVLEPLASKHKRKESSLIADFEIKASGDIVKIAELYIEKNKRLMAAQELTKYLGMSGGGVQKVVNGLVATGRIIEVSAGEEVCYLSKLNMEQWEEYISREIQMHLQKYPLEPGLNKETLRVKLSPEMTLKEYNALIQYWVNHGVIDLCENQFLVLHGYQRSVEGLWAEKVGAVEQYFYQNQWQIPSWERIKTDLSMDQKTGNQVLQHLLRSQKLFPLAEDIYIWGSFLEEAKDKIKTWFESSEVLTVAQARDLLGASRKIAVPLLEYLDKTRYTVRTGEYRKLADR